MKVNNCCFNLTTIKKKACWELTTKCNLNCNHCFAKRNSSQYISSDRNLKDDLATILRIHKLGVKHLIFSGGEPLLYPSLLPLISKSKSLGITAAIATNGTLLTKNMCEQLFQSGLSKATVSLDGYDPHTNQLIRGTNEAYSKALRGAGFLADSGVLVTINVVLHSAIINHLKEFIVPLQECGAQTLNFTFPVCHKYGDCDIDTMENFKEEIYEEIFSLQDIFDNIQIQVNEPKCDMSNCPAGKEIIGINAHGEIVDCLVKGWKYGYESPLNKCIVEDSKLCIILSK